MERERRKIPCTFQEEGMSTWALNMVRMSLPRTGVGQQGRTKNERVNKWSSNE